MREQIHGTTMPVLSIHLDPGESVVAEAGEFSWMTDSIQMSTQVPADLGGGAGGRGLMGALKRAVGGSSPLMSTYTAQGCPGTITFAAKVPGSILPVDVGPGAEYLVHRHGFLAGTPGIEVSAGFQRSFRAEAVPVHQVLRPGHVGMFRTSVSFQVVRVPGVANRYFGGDAHYFAELSGPGTVWLQSMPLPQVAASLVPYLPAAPDRPEPVEGGLVGGIMGDVLT